MTKEQKKESRSRYQSQLEFNQNIWCNLVSLITLLSKKGVMTDEEMVKEYKKTQDRWEHEKVRKQVAKND